MQYQSITTDGQLRQFCRELAGQESIAFDTEFVSEHTYRPVLCLIQVATPEHLAVIDPIACGDVEPFWQVIAEPGHETIVHAGRGEIEFCLHAVGRRPTQLFDVQMAAGLIGVEYSAGYSTLISRLLGEPLQKHETRTDWRRRPLSKRQIEYALDDARFLHPLRDKLHAELERLGRIDWLTEEIDEWQDAVQSSLSSERWRRVSGNSGFDSRGLAIIRELWRWREAEAQRRNSPVRRVLRDDLIVELARRRSDDVKQIGALRGMDRSDLKRKMEGIAGSIRRALELPEAVCPQVPGRKSLPQHAVLGQFLFSALGSVCRKSQLSPSLVGTPNDIRELIAYRTASKKKPLTDDKLPKLARGWRTGFVGDLFDDLLAGKTSIRIEDPTSDHPLAFEPNRK